MGTKSVPDLYDHHIKPLPKRQGIIERGPNSLALSIPILEGLVEVFGRAEQIGEARAQVVHSARQFYRAARTTCEGCMLTAQDTRARTEDEYPCSWPCQSRNREEEAKKQLLQAVKELEDING